MKSRALILFLVLGLANSFAQESKGENFDKFKGRPKIGYKLTTGLMKEPYRNSAQVGGD